VVNIALEGIILTGAFAAAAATIATGSAVLGLLAGAAAGALIGLLHGFACIVLRTDQVISGVALNLLSLSGTVLLLKIIYRSRGSSPQLPETLPTIGGVPVLTFVALALVPIVLFAMNRTTWGLRLRACGESPHAADAVGIRVNAYRLSGVLVSGVLAGLAGVHLAMTAGSFAKGMSAGRGYIALAAVVFGRWRPVTVAIGCLVFALGRAAQDVLELWVDLPSDTELGTLTPAIPYVLTLLVLAARPLFGKGRGKGPPAALGKGFVRS
jgi:simple sugar transport system permease protein